MQLISTRTFNDLPIHTIEYQDRPVWTAKEIEEALGYTTPGKLASLCSRSKELEEGRHYIKIVGAEAQLLAGALPAAGNANKTRNYVLLTEEGIYKVFLLSEAPRAAEFREWLASVLLPSLRRGELTQAAPQPAMSATDLTAMVTTIVRSVVAELHPPVKAIEEAVRPPDSLRAGDIALKYMGLNDGNRRKLTAQISREAAKLRKTCRTFGVRAKSDSFAAGTTWYYSPAEEMILVSRLSLKVDVGLFDQSA